MPPKRKGHTLVGKQKVFRHAVEHVRLGLGHTVLGNLTLGLAASSPGSAVDGSAATPRPAFYVELNEQLLSHSSKDFKKFRWEVLELCETVPLFHLHHRQLAQKLLARLMDRGTQRVVNEDDDANATRRRKATAAGERADGSTTQAYEAFARLTIAFVRDMGSKFLPYFQLFQQAVQAGMYDQAGHLIVDTARLQLVFAVQAAWCRELRGCWAEPAHAPLVRRIVRQYVGQLHDTKEYVRRLSAELLAFLCRLSRPLLPLVAEEACGDVLRSYEETSIAAAEADRRARADADSETDGDEEDGDAESDDSAEVPSPSAAIWSAHASLLDFTRTTLPDHPVVDGLTFFAAELFRGLRGSLSSSFETHYVRLLHVFQLLQLPGGAHDGAADVVHSLHVQRHPLAPFLDAHDTDDGTADGVAAARRNRDLHSTRWATVLGLASAADSETDNDDGNEEDGDDSGSSAPAAEGASVRSDSDLRGARYVLRCIGGLVLGSALATVLRETRKQSSLPSPGDDEDDDEGASEDEVGGAADEDVLVSSSGAAISSSSSSASTRPSHRVLAAAVLSLDTASWSPSWPQYVQLLTVLTGAANFALWVDGREAALLRQLATHLAAAVRHRPAATAEATSALEVAAAVLRLLSPLCISAYVAPAAAASSSNSSYLLQVQQWFVPVAKAAVLVCTKAAAKATRDASHGQLGESAQLILFAFAQDVLQKNYALALEQERRIAEEADVRDVAAGTSNGAAVTAAPESREDAYVSDDESEGEDGGNGTTASARRREQQQQRRHHRIPSYLTPFALTLLHTIGMALWRGAAGDAHQLRSCVASEATAASSSEGLEAATAVVTAQRQCNVRRAVLLCRLLQDHTQHMAVSPLQQLLRLKSMPAPATNAAKSGSTAAEAEKTAREVLEALVLELLRLYRAAQSARRSRVCEEALAYVSCALPLIQLLVSTAPATAAAVSPVYTALLELLQQIEAQEAASAPADTALTTRAATSLDPAVYALYAEVTAMLVQAGAGAGAAALERRTQASKKEGKRQLREGGTPAAAASLDRAEGLRHLCRTVAVLVHGFQQVRRANGSGLSERDAQVDFSGAVVHTLSDEARVQLLHGAEVLLRALLWMLGLDSESQLLLHEEDANGQPPRRGANGAAEALAPHTLAALRTLRVALPHALHAAFVHDVLLECLAAPIAGLRLLTLRLLRLLCHPALEAEDRLVGAPAVPLELLDALLRAARFNPLSHTGNLDGMRQELSQLTYQVESGAITQPFPRQLIASTMVGFLYVKFTGAWAIASKVLCGLVALEQTSLTNLQALEGEGERGEGDDETADGHDDGAASQQHQQRRRRLDPVVWKSVICAYARSLIMGDVVGSARGAAGGPGAVAVADDQAADENGADEAPGATAVADCLSQLASLPCWYEVRLTDQQRHVKGELVSRAFSSTQYSTAAVTLLESAKADFEVVRWERHWATTSEGVGGAVVAALYATSTDRATLAQTFLAMMEAMVKSSPAVDRKVRLVEDVVLELVAIERNRHPGGIDASQLRKFDQRLEVAMRACAAAPSGVLTPHQRKRVADAVQREIDARNAELQTIFVSYLSEANPRLQRVAVDNLKRLRVEPFHTYHAKLAPYCDTMKALFAFLSTFHVETDVPAHDRVAYISTALSLALPKLLTKVSKDKLKDQAVLSRRLMGYLEHLPSTTHSHGAPARDALADVLDQLLHRLLAFAMPAAAASAVTAVDTGSYDFLANVWADIVYGGCGMAAAGRSDGEPRRRSSHHGVRRLERLMKQLGSALRLLEAMLHAVGQRFAVYVATCLHIAMQAYLVSCKQALRAPVEDLLARLAADPGAPEERVRRWVALLNKALASSALSTAFARVRRAAVAIVALLSEQFPDEVVHVLRGGDAVAPAAPLFTRYLTMLFENSKGTTLDGGARAAAVTGGGAAKSAVTPVLRLLLAWARSPALLPLYSAYAGIAVGTLQEVFAVAPAAASVHRASVQTLGEGLRCVSELLSCADEPVLTLPTGTGESAAVAVVVGRAAPAAEERHKRRSSSRLASTRTTFRQAFLEPHLVGVFTALYTLLTSGAAREEEEGKQQQAAVAAQAAGAVAAAATGVATPQGSSAALAPETQRGPPPQRAGTAPRAAKGRHGGAHGAREQRRRPTSIMSLSVSMWREVMHTIAQLSRFLRTDAAAAAAPSSLAGMMSRLLELALKMVAHPVCMTDASTAQMVTGIAQALMEQVAQVDHRAHWQPLVRLFNVVVNPHARQTLCAILAAAVTKLPGPGAAAEASWFTRQLAAAARAVVCLNSFENAETLERYDFELRYHTLHSLTDFFAHFGNYGALQRGNSGSGSAVRRERVYDGAEDVQLPLDKEHAPVLAPEAVAVLAANVIFFLRDPEQTIRALVLPLLQSMVRYAALGEAQAAYRAQLLETTLRHEVLASLRRGVVAKEVHIRCAHMQAFEGFARYFAVEFPSFALLYSPNTEQNFYANVGHVQHRCRLHALALLRQHAPAMHVRDVLRVFVPFLMSAVKDFAEGKRNQANLTEGRARGYCDAVLLTVSAIAARLPWTAYYRVLSLFLSNASANANLRATMLRGVVQVLNTFHYLDGDDEEAVEEGERGAAVLGALGDEDEEEGEDEVNDADAAVRAELSAKQRAFRHAKVMRVLEADVLPQLYSYIGDKEGSKAVGSSGRGAVNQHSITAVRREQQREDAAATQAKNALLQLPVALAITKIVKHFPEDRFNVHVDHLLDELIKKLRTKNDKHRESARRILGAMLQETGPSKLKFVVTKLKDNLVHGYQLHVLGYTVVTLLYQLYEPNSKLLAPTARPSAAGTRPSARGAVHDPVQEALAEAAKQRPARRQRREDADEDGADTTADAAHKEEREQEEVVDEDTAVERAEEALLRELGTTTHAGFDYQYGIDCLTRVLEELLLIFLDDYLGEVGVQKEQVEVMSTMVEVKRNRALQGFAFLGKHCDAATVMEAFLHRITWVLTPPAETAVNASELHGSARARALLVQEMQSKYMTISKGGSVDLLFVNKVRLLAVRVARSLMTNPTMSVEKSFAQVRRLLEQHNRTREEKISAFEAKDGTRRIRGNAHLILHKADRQSRKEQFDSNYLVAAVPERVDVDFSAHTVLATQQKQKLRVYRGRYGKEVKEAAKNFYREDPVTAVVLDTLDEFLLKFLLSVLKQVLGIGKEKRYSKAAMKLDMLRHHRARRQRTDEQDGDGGEEEEEGRQAAETGAEDENGVTSNADADEDDEASDGAAAAAGTGGEDDVVDGLETFAEAQAVAEGNVNKPQRAGPARGTAAASASTPAALLAPGSDLTVTFTREHRDLLESLVPAVLTCLQGEGSDAVVANALDCLLALVSLRPPLNAVNGLQRELFETVTSFIERGSVIKQRAIRLTAAMVTHQKYVVSDANATQLVKLVRAEVMERNDFMSVSLSLLYAILGKHVHIAEIYDLMDVITELLLHWGAHTVIRRRCILILVRFLLEYRLTPEKFKSHIDLYCRNLDYPELTGRTALLELLDALVVRLPAVILRDEAPVLLVPLAATVTGSEWVECRQQGGTVLQHLARYAGVDVLVPVLSSWLAASQPRATRSMGMQTWATIVPALAEFYELDAAHAGADDDAGDVDEDVAAARAQNRAAFQACCAWSVQAVLDGCLFDQVAAAHRNKRLDQLSAKAREKVELDGWAYIFYSLRAAEAMLTALPHELYPLLAPRLLPHLTEVLLLHSHPWVRAVAMRVLRHYLYSFVEAQCHYLQEDVWHQLACAAATAEATESSGAESALPFIAPAAVQSAEPSASSHSPKAAVSEALQTLQHFATLLKRLLGLVSSSDVAMETYNAHRAIADPARAELLKVAVYVLRAQIQLAVLALTRAATANRPRHYRDVQQRVGAVYAALQHQLASLAAPVVQQGSLVNYMVRSATLLQLLGGWMSVLPHAATDDAAGTDGLNAQVRWLSQTQLCPAALLRNTVVPLLGLGLRAKPISEKISLIAYQVAGVVEQQLAERRHELTGPCLAAAAGASERDAARGKKRARVSAAGDDVDGTAADDAAGSVPLDEVLVLLKTQLANVHDARRDQQVVQSTKKAMKRNRRQMELEEKRAMQQQQQRRRSSSGTRSSFAPASAAGGKKSGSPAKAHRRRA